MSFLSPQNLDELIKILQNKTDNTFFVAGGTDLAIKINEKNIFNYNLIDLTHVKEMKAITEDDSCIYIGSAVTIDEIAFSQIISKNLYALKLSCSSIGSKQIRNRATIGGNVANASQSADTLPVLFALDAECEIINENGKKYVDKVESIVVGLGKTKLSDKEVITKFIIKKNKLSSSFAKVGDRKRVTISKINCSIVADVSNNIIKNAIIYFGAIGAKPIRANILEAKLSGQSLNIKIADFKNAVEEEVLKAIPDRISRFYKKSAAVGVVADALLLLKEGK